ncbi:MAG TPA: S9 family peptidase [Chlamydiales bacterium]|nr:S9 family peptidase [Chlamydiales bacterium]
MFKKLIVVLFCMSAIHADLIPRKIIFGNPDKTMVRLSPDGKMISYLAPHHGVLNIWIAPVDHIQEATVISNDTDRGIRQYFWSYDPDYILYLQDFKGDENFRLYSYNLATHETRLLTPEKDVKTVIFAGSVAKPKKLLIGMNARNQSYFDVYLLDLKSGKLKLVIENDDYSELIADNNLHIRFGIKLNEHGDQEIFEREKNGWKFFMKIPMENTMNSSILGFNKKNDTIYILDSRDSDTAVLKTLHLKTGVTKVIAEDSKADLKPFTTHPTNKNIQAIEINYDKPRIQVLDKTIAKEIEHLNTFHKGHFQIVSRSKDDKKWIVAYADDQSPAKYYLYDRTKLEYLFTSNPALEKAQLAPMKPVVIRSRDGFDLVCYLTQPNGKGPHPMILFVHGGPWARDEWGLNATHQWLANRGYAVLSVNYRGSTGFGKKFVNAGNLEWSGKMHDDLIDCVNWAVSNNIAEIKKIGIMGGSYGGYATLVGLTFTPDVFACGVDIVGPSNLMTLCQSFPPYWKPLISDMKKRIGDWDTESGAKALSEKSPISLVNKIQKPLLIAQGAFDPRVKQAEADQIVDAMKMNHIPVIYALYPSEGHGFANPNNRLSFYALTEQFLADVLGGKAEPIGSDFSGADFVLNGVNHPTPDTAVTIIKENIHPVRNE